MNKVPNQNTQPISSFPVFNNWNSIAVGWYYVCKSEDIKINSIKGFNICGQEIVIFRNSKNKLAGLDAYCPHMGTHFGVGKVVNDNIQCFFHHWKYDQNGACVDIPCQTKSKEVVKRKSSVQAYSVCEKFGAVWIYPDINPPFSFAEFDEFSSDDCIIEFGESYTRSCHHHVTMINGIDPQHLKTVHSIDIEMSVDIKESSSGNIIDIVMKGFIGDSNLKEKVTQKILGKSYSYAMRYDHANNGLLTLMKDVRLFGSKRKLPTLHMIFAYRPIGEGKTMVQPIYINKKRNGFFGYVKNKFLIFLTKRAFFALQGEDGKVYENMRFYPKNLLEIDRPIASYIQYVNKLKTSAWSETWKAQ